MIEPSSFTIFILESLCRITGVQFSLSLRPIWQIVSHELVSDFKVPGILLCLILVFFKELWNAYTFCFIIIDFVLFFSWKTLYVMKIGNIRLTLYIFCIFFMLQCHFLDPAVPVLTVTLPRRWIAVSLCFNLYWIQLFVINIKYGVVT